MSSMSLTSRLRPPNLPLRSGWTPPLWLSPARTRYRYLQTSIGRKSLAHDKFTHGQESQNNADSQYKPWSPHRISIVCSTACVGAFGYAAYYSEFKGLEYSKVSEELRRRNQEIRKRIEDLEIPLYMIEYAADKREKKMAVLRIGFAIGHDNVSCDELVIEQHSHPDWSKVDAGERPVALVYPMSTLDVVKIAEICHECKLRIVPFGGGSSVEGIVFSPQSGICMDFSNMNKIFELQPDDMTITVHPGVNWVDLNNEIAHSGLFLPLDPSSRARFGGMVATNCSGTNSLRYGTMKDWVMNLTVVLADGSVVNTKRMSPKTSAGYDLTSWFVGTGGILGIITEVTLKLAPIPENTSVAIVPFDSIKEATSAAQRLRRSGVQLVALNMMDDVQMQVLNNYGSSVVCKRAWDEKPTLFFKFAGTASSVQSDITNTKALLGTVNADALHLAETKQEEIDLWAARKEAFIAMGHARPKGANICYTDVAVPPSHLAQIIAIIYDPDNVQQKAAMGTAVRRMRDRAPAMAGTISGNYGIGIGKKDALISDVGVETIEFIKKIKERLDPRWIMNPGKVIDIPNYTPKSWGWKSYFNVGSGLKEDIIPPRLWPDLDDENPIL